MHALIDADRLAYSCGGAKDDYGYPLEWPLVASRIDRNINSILDAVGSVTHTLYITADDKSNFRIRVATIRPYKGQRPSDKPFWYDQVRKYLAETYQASIVSGMEADDAIGIAQCSALAGDLLHWQYYNWSDESPTEEWVREKLSNTIICSVDKDLNNIPGWHYDELSKKTYFVSETESLRNFYSQLLAGDPVDNIPSLYGVGRKSQVLRHLHTMVEELDMYCHVREQYEKRFGSYSYNFLLENGTLLWILRSNNIGECRNRFEGLECQYLEKMSQLD